MIKVNVQNITNGLKFAGVFKTDQEADEWILKQTELKSWGESERDFVVEKVDVTISTNKEKQIEKVKEEQARGKRLRDKLSSLIRFKLVNREITIQDLATFVELEAVKKVERYLENGYLTLAKLTMQAGDFGPVVSEEEKQEFITEL